MKAIERLAIKQSNLGVIKSKFRNKKTQTLQSEDSRLKRQNEGLNFKAESWTNELQEKKLLDESRGRRSWLMGMGLGVGDRFCRGKEEEKQQTD